MHSVSKDCLWYMRPCDRWLLSLHEEDWPEASHDDLICAKCGQGIARHYSFAPLSLSAMGEPIVLASRIVYQFAAWEGCPDGLLMPSEMLHC